MNPELLQLMQQWEMLQRLAGPMAMNLPQSLGSPFEAPLFNSGQVDAYNQLQQIMGHPNRQPPAPQMTREPQKVGKPGFLESIRISNPDYIIGETLRGANERSQRDLARERARGGY